MGFGFNEGLITEILLRLPIKSILRFKTVSKQWLSIASSPRFRQIHASRIASTKGVFFTKCPELIPKLEFLPFENRLIPTTFPVLDLPINLKSSSGGLLLLLSRRCQSFDLQLRCVLDYFVCNPTTNEFKHLPAVPKLIRDSKLVCETLAFDPCKSPHYKIAFLCKYHELNNQKFQIVIYSSENQTFSWPQPTTLVNFRFCGVYYNDAIHWISYHNHNYSFCYYDLKTECMKESPLPPNLFRFALYIGVSRGHLHLVTSVDPPEISLFEIYELKSDFSGWSLKYQVTVARLENFFSKSMVYSAIGYGRLNVLSIFVELEEGGEESLKIKFLLNDSLVSCQCKYNLYFRLTDSTLFSTRGSIYDDRHRMYGWGWFVAHPYIETLACVDLPKTKRHTTRRSNKKRLRFG